MATTDTYVSKKRLQKEKPNLYKRMHSERQGFVDVVEKFRYMKIKRTKMDIRKESKINFRLYKSLQTCTVKNNMKKLMALRDNTKGSKMKSQFDALINVLEHLQLPDNYLTPRPTIPRLDSVTYFRPGSCGEKISFKFSDKKSQLFHLNCS